MSHLLTFTVRHLFATPLLFALMSCICDPVWAKKQKKRDSVMAISYAQRADAMTFAQEVGLRHEIDPDQIRQVLSQALLNKKIQQLMAPAPTGFQKNWQVYKSRFIEPKRVAAGVHFWKEHRTLLEKAEQVYGVPASIVVGILGVETIYGKDTGNFRVLDALTTLAFDFPATHPRMKQRQAYFLQELEQFLLMTHKNGINPLRIKGSYAGAMGWPQFMPS